MDEMNLFPYLGRSKNLIENFFIIGIDENILSEIGQNIFENGQNLEITVISDIISDAAFENVDIMDIISQVYPDKQNIIIKDNAKNEPNPTSVTFTYFFNSTFYSCYALKFYEKTKIGESDYFISKSFVIISEYPYFTTFHIICSQIFKMNICKQNDAKDSINNIEGKNNINNIPIEIFIHCLVNYIPSPLNKKIVLDIFPNNKIIIPELTGYPYIDFDICNLLFNKDKPVKINNFIKVYILMFLEIDLLIFCPDHEKLNLIMCLLVNLIYPLIDSEYSKHIKSLSKKKLSNGFDVMYPTFRGMISNFDSKINLSNFRGLNFIVEFDDKMETILLGNEIENEKEKKEIYEKRKLLEYIDKIYNYKNAHSSFLASYLTILRKELENIRIEYKKYKSNNNSFFNINEEIIKFNKKVQEAFYNFNLNIMKIFYNDYKLDNSKFEIIENRDKIKNTNNDFSEEEIIFMKIFRETTRYNKYYVSFVKHFESIDELKFAHLFSDDFIINLKMNTNKYDNVNNYFEIMDRFFDPNSNENESDKNCVIDYEYLFKDFEEFYQEKIEQKINRIKTKSQSKLFALNKKILNEFLFYKNNKEFFKSLKEKEKNKMEFKRIKKMYIAKIIEYHHIPQEINNTNINSEEIINNNENNNDEYWISCSFIFIFSIVFPFFSHSNIIIYLKDLLINTLNKIEYFQRYYIEIVLKSIYYYYLYNEKRGMFPDLTLENIKSYYNIILKELIIKKSILSKEEILFFFKKILHDDNKNKNKIIKNENNINTKPEKNNIFQYDKDIEEIKKIIKQDIIKEKDVENLVFIFSNKKELKRKKMNNGKEIHSKIYLIYKEFLINNFELKKFDFKILKIIINVIHLTKSQELSLFLYKSMNILKNFESHKEKKKKKSNK